MEKSVMSCLLAIAITPLYAETVSSTSILTIPKNHPQTNLVSTQRESSRLEGIDIYETMGIRNSLAKTPLLAVIPQTNSQSQVFSRINHLIDSIAPISSSIQTKIAVSATKDSQHPSSIESPVPPQFPKISRKSLFSDTSRQSSLVNPAPETERIASVFGWRIRPFSGRWQMHNGIDYGAPLGSPVVAAKDGIVTKVVSGCLDFRQRWCGSQFGNWIEIDHGDGIVATYAHLLNNSIAVKEGTKVWQNQEIAKVGSSGWSTGAHLDFRIKVNGEFKNPVHYMR